MAAQGGGIVFQEKVSRLLARGNGRPVLKPNKKLVLGDSVANRRLGKGEATCITEMSVLMACWKQNNFVDSLCFREMTSFYTCVNKAQAAVKNQSSLQGGRLPPKQVNTLLKRFPNVTSEI
ncbi:coiled-coil-helix-coiled-coil-helix domain-containing protein 1-like [Takifugu rubripes]|uniref:Coiled-coil-helix-coiled-coil-helix domain containing 1 n=2 Tax=Takifugu TaxID=31032 RepID=A0A674NDY8_TAKRU|nr:coiled-coil-helix-coiled-coil-helix domain-containing protein 1 [Takifugu rubripes]XP_029687863.1 coiled-coil-helix-coiled-coil-helix domain-containing protein 1-like [Takifugu rubripes]XP_056879377.1 coiled-coil-helix-coiled-coil-helix domain-containing protein 1 [Takifugu flavidus]TWW54232.1 28S ribosomal protein S37 [Takifugu flavidus]|eukprot:XP_003976559.1 PREDICTED: coiled-coil-helix-coiled-coil-helix domain-containing protein 1 [Takifugu rubripes]